MNLQCPVPLRRYPRVLMAHGGGGRLMHDLISRLFADAFSNPYLDRRHDGAALDVSSLERAAFTTDGYVVRPRWFPGGNIGELAVYGTVNDLAMCGATPLYLSAAFVLEEGLEIEELWRIALAMRQAADRAGVHIVTGDTKVVDRGKGDGVFITTSGVGKIPAGIEIAPQHVRPDDVILLSGDIGRHGMAIMAVREGLEFESAIESDCAPLHESVAAVTAAAPSVRCLRDLTRGGLASALVEIAEASGLCLRISETHIPVREDVRGACEILGFDPLYVANEGRYIAIVAPEQATAALAAMRSVDVSRDAVIIGHAEAAEHGEVILRSAIGANRVVDMLSGEQLPRIC